MKRRSGRMTSTPGSFSPSGKVMPRSTISHGGVVRPEAVEVDVHADLAEAAERQEHEFVAAAHPAAGLRVLAHAAPSCAAPSATSPSELNSRTSPSSAAARPVVETRIGARRPALAALMVIGSPAGRRARSSRAQWREIRSCVPARASAWRAPAKQRLERRRRFSVARNSRRGAPEIVGRRNVQPEADNGDNAAAAPPRALDQNSAHLGRADQYIVRPFEPEAGSLARLRRWRRSPRCRRPATAGRRRRRAVETATRLA